MPIPKGSYLLDWNLRGFIVVYKDYDTYATIDADAKRQLFLYLKVR